MSPVGCSAEWSGTCKCSGDGQQEGEEEKINLICSPTNSSASSVNMKCTSTPNAAGE